MGLNLNAVTRRLFFSLFSQRYVGKAAAPNTDPVRSPEDASKSPTLPRAIYGSKQALFTGLSF